MADKTAMRAVRENQTWFADDLEEDASNEDGDDGKEDKARDRKEHPPLQNYGLDGKTEEESETAYLQGKNSKLPKLSYTYEDFWS